MYTHRLNIRHNLFLHNTQDTATWLGIVRAKKKTIASTPGFFSFGVECRMRWTRCLLKLELLITTLASQLYYFDMCGKASIVAVGLVCGNSMLATSTLHNDPFDALVSSIYGLTVVVFATQHVLTSIAFVTMKQVGLDGSLAFLCLWTWINGVLFFGAMTRRSVYDMAFFSCICIGTMVEIVATIVSSATIELGARCVLVISLISPMVEITLSVLHHRYTHTIATQPPEEIPQHSSPYDFP